MGRLNLHVGTIFVVGMMTFGRASCAKNPIASNKKSESKAAAVASDPRSALVSSDAVHISPFQLPDGVTLSAREAPDAGAGFVNLGSGGNAVEIGGNDVIAGEIEIHLLLSQAALDLLNGIPDNVVVMFKVDGKISIADAAHCLVTHSDAGYVFAVRTKYIPGMQMWLARKADDEAVHQSLEFHETLPPLTTVDAGSTVVPPTGIPYYDSSANGSTGASTAGAGPSGLLPTISLDAAAFSENTVRVSWSSTGNLAGDPRKLIIKRFATNALPASYKNFDGFSTDDTGIAPSDMQVVLKGVPVGSYLFCAYWLAASVHVFADCAGVVDVADYGTNTMPHGDGTTSTTTSTTTGIESMTGTGGFETTTVTGAGASTTGAETTTGLGTSSFGNSVGTSTQPPI